MFARRILGGTMFLAVCSAVAALACSDIDRPLDQRGTKPIAQLQQEPPILLSLTCEMNSNSSSIACKSPITAAPPGVNASVIYGATATYAIFFPYNLVKDTVAHTWQFTAYLQNLLKQSIGTLNGTATTGVKVFVTDFHATTGTGAVSVANADGTGTFTAPNQPYFNYNQISAPSGYSGNKLWKFNVPNTVSAVSMSILISTDFPAEQSVTVAPPATLPTWVHSDTNTSGRAGTTAIPGRFTKQIVLVYFRPTATLADRQLAIAFVNGTVVGGKLYPDGMSGYYAVQVQDDGTGSGILSARSRLRTLPQVETAVVEGRFSVQYLRPDDDGDYKKWGLNPDSTDLANKNWSLEAIDAPFAWGCSVGRSTQKIGVADMGMHAIDDIYTNIDPASRALVHIDDTTHHGTLVLSELAAVGNNQKGMTGVMWRAAVRTIDPSLDSLHNFRFKGFLPDGVGDAIAIFGRLKIPVVNISIGMEWIGPDSVHAKKPGSAADILLANDAFTNMMEGLRISQRQVAGTQLPLIVVAAGNFPYAGNAGSTDSWWSVVPRLADSLHDTVLVVGASNQTRGVAWFSGVNAPGGHNYVDLMAPGDSIWSLNADGLFEAHSGTSLAAPEVTGAAGLLVSFDSTLGTMSPGFGAPELKRLILSGADSNMTPEGNVRMVGPYKFLSLYKPLVLAARRPGAPLCGNRVWSVNGQVVAMRNSTVNETLFSTGESGGYMTVMHGGHRIHFLGDSSFNDREFVFDGTHWNEATNPDTLPPAIPGGSAYSELQASHDGDSAVIVQAFQNGAAEQVNVSLEAVSTRLTKPLSSWSVPLSDNSSHFCRSQGARFETDTLPPFATHFRGYVCGDSTGVSGSFETANAQAAYSPLGDRVIVTINRSITQSTGVQDWQTCPGSTADPYTGVPLRQCRSASYQQTDEAALVYAVRTADGARSQLTNVAAGDVFWRAVSEPGTELVLGIGAVTSTWDIVPYYFYNQATGGSSLTFIDSNSTRLVSNCRLEYRTLATGTVNSTTPTNDPCTADGLEGSGTFSPRRVANSGAN
jgi:hypothetical protein